MIHLNKNNYRNYLKKLEDLGNKRQWYDNVVFNIWEDEDCENILLTMHLYPKIFEVYQDKFEEMLSNARQGNIKEEKSIAHIATNFFILERIVEEIPELEGNHIMVDVDSHTFNREDNVIDVMNKNKYYTINGKYDAEDIKLIKTDAGDILKDYYIGIIERR